MKIFQKKKMTAYISQRSALEYLNVVDWDQGNSSSDEDDDNDDDNNKNDENDDIRVSLELPLTMNKRNQ